MRFHEANHGIYFDDLDVFRVLHNARYPLLIEGPSVLSGRKWGGVDYQELERNPDQFQLVRVNHFEYIRAVEGVDEVRVRVWVEKLGRTSLIFGFSVLPIDEDTPYAIGHRVLVCVDPDARQPKPWSNEFKKLAPYRKDI